MNTNTISQEDHFYNNSTGNNFLHVFSPHINEQAIHGEELYGLCPFHDDHKPSWSGNIENGLWQCFGCGARGNDKQFVERVGGRTNGSAPVRRGSWIEVGRWTYHDLTGKRWIDIVRYQTPTGKAYRQYDHKVGKWVEKDGHQLPNPRPLYNWHQLDKADEVILAEGELCAQILTEMGRTTTTTIGGAQSVSKTDYSPLRGKSVVIWPDNDDPGRKYAADVAKRILAVGGAVRIVEIPPGKPEGWDVADARAEGWDDENIRSLLDSAKPYIPQRTLSALTISEFASCNIAPRQYYLSPWLPEKGLAMIYGWRGSGKSFLVQTIAYTISASGKLFGRWEAKEPRRVLYVDGELPARVIQERLRAIIKGTEQEADPTFFQIIAADQQENGIPDLATREGQSAIEEHLPADVLILDNLSCLVRSGVENDAESWIPVQEWLLRLRRQGIAVLLVHHSGNSGRQRGTSKREDILDTVISLKVPKDYSPEQGARFEVHFQKARGFYGTEALPFEVQLHQKDGCALWTAKNLEAAEIEQVAAFLRDGYSQRDIHKETGFSIGKVNNLAKEARKQKLLGA